MLSVLLLSACLKPTPDPDWGTPSDDSGPVDADGDGSPEGEDCDDADPDTHPGATELCDDLDQDCDGAVDEGLDQTWYLDADGDGYGLAGDTVVACAQPATHAAEAGDCDDSLSSVYPGAEELCNGVDDDCDEVVDLPMTALAFEQASDKVIIPDSDLLDLGPQGTIEFWLWLDGINDEEFVGGILGKYRLTQEDKTFTTYFDDLNARTGERIGATFLTPLGRGVVEADRDIPLATWVHVAVAWDESNATLYLAGSPVSSREGGVDPLDSDADLYLGNLLRTGDILSDVPSFVGMLQDLRISDVRRYTESFTPANELTVDADTQVLYSLREGSGSQVYDSAGAGEPGQLQGAEWVEVECRPEP
ncbi:MAG: hypothetical protein H6741_12160 [Alphaproteobacteria bacterium]|nr:hypothetical protein [Alphaproteobacteria bacterium]